VTFFNGTAVAFFAVFDDAIAAGAEVFQLDFSKKGGRRNYRTESKWQAAEVIT
jgi:hypothetical protein